MKWCQALEQEVLENHTISCTDLADCDAVQTSAQKRVDTATRENRSFSQHFQRKQRSRSIRTDALNSIQFRIREKIDTLQHIHVKYLFLICLRLHFRF